VLLSIKKSQNFDVNYPPIFNLFVIGKFPSKYELKSIDSYRSIHRKPMELRNIAMVMIGIKMGLWASDIVNLRFSDIVWKNQCITVIQQKTKAELSLPLSVEAGNSIYTYIRSGSKSPYIFIHHTVPYRKLEKGACLKALKEILPERNAPETGFHMTRKTIATMLLRGVTNVLSLIH
jgi:integrase